MKMEDMPVELKQILTEMKAITEGVKDKKEVKKILENFMKDKGYPV